MTQITEINHYKVGNKYVVPYGSLAYTSYETICSMSLSEIYAELSIHGTSKSFGLQETKITDIIEHKDSNNLSYYSIKTGTGPMYYCPDDNDDDFKDLIDIAKCLLDKGFNEYYCPEGYTNYLVTYSKNKNKNKIFTASICIPSGTKVSDKWFLYEIWQAEKIIEYKDVEKL